MGTDVITCGGCGSSSLHLFLDMGRQPLAEGYDTVAMPSTDARHPLMLLRCANCLLVQLSHIVDPREVFPAEHPYTTGNSRALREHYADLACQLVGNLLVGDVVVDIGANDGTLLRALRSLGRGKLVRVAVEPTNQILKCGPEVVKYQQFFTRALAAEIREVHGPAMVVTACNVFAHVPDPHDFLDGVLTLLDGDGVFVTENHDLASITEGMQIDTIYHEHLRYYSVASLSALLEKHGFRVVSSQQTPMHGGSFRVTARKASGRVAQRAGAAATALRGKLWQIAVREKQDIYGIGATTRATPLIHYAGIQTFLKCVCEVPGSEKIGKVIPGTQLKVVDERKLIEDQPPYALLLSWHIAGDIMPKLRAAGYRGKFIIPLPTPEVISD